MQNNYSKIASQVQKLESVKRSNFFQSKYSSLDSRFEDEKFSYYYQILKERYYATFMLFGEKNFQEISYLYFQTNPIQSAKVDKIGSKFVDFLNTVDQINSFYFIRYIAMLDWFWYVTDSPRMKIELPKGTLSSWSSILNGLDEISIELDEYEVETLSVEKNGKEYRIIEVK